MPATPAQITAPFSFPATPRTPRPRPRRSSIDPNEPYTPTGSAKAARFLLPAIEPLPPITAADRTGPPREVYKARGQLDPYYVFSKPPRAQRPSRPSEKQGSPKREVKQHYPPLCTSPGAKVRYAHTTPVSDDPEMKQ
ncbi:hypothetical protein FRC11_005415 [Ceratobasidium sp. 423]|nr:hypothetical protein FRC11_005415 [Ceratobasidium sp. 423]